MAKKIRHSRVVKTKATKISGGRKHSRNVMTRKGPGKYVPHKPPTKRKPQPTPPDGYYRVNGKLKKLPPGPVWFV